MLALPCDVPNGSQPGETWIRLFSMTAVPLVHDSVSSLNATIRHIQEDLEDALEDGVIISKPEHMRELYYSTYQLPFTVLRMICTAQLYYSPV